MKDYGMKDLLSWDAMHAMLVIDACWLSNSLLIWVIKKKD